MPKLTPKEAREWLYERDDVLGVARRESEESGARSDGIEDPAFAKVWDRVPSTSITEMSALALAVSDPRCAEDYACRTLIGFGIRDGLQRFWAYREQARKERDQAMERALEGSLGSTEAERITTRVLAEALSRRTGDGLERLALDLPREAYPLGYEAACQTRAIGRLDEAFKLFQRYSSHHAIHPDDPLPLPPRAATYGVVQIASEYFEGGPLSYRRVVPRVKGINWQRFEHVIGLGTTITPEILSVLEVPDYKQHIIEVHRDTPHAVGRSFPLLKGRVAIVDDVHEGETSLLVARLYRGCVVNVAPDLTPICSYLFEAPQPIASIIDDEVTALVGRKYTDRYLSTGHWKLPIPHSMKGPDPDRG